MKYLTKIIFDVYLCFSATILFIGADFFINPLLTPSMHPIRIPTKGIETFVTLAALILFAYHQWKRKLGESYIISFLKKINFTFIQWTWTVFALLSLLFSYSSWIRHQVFETSFDFAIFAQAIWNTWNGDFLYSSIKGGICLLGDHVSPILALWSPCYALWKDPSFLLLLQATTAASCVLPIFLIAREILKNDRWAFLFVIAYALYAPIKNAVRFDFHPEVMGDCFILWAFFFLLKKRYSISSIFLALVLMTKEVACAPVAMLGLYCCFFRKERVFGLVWFLISIIYFILCVKVIAPHYSGQGYFYSGNYFLWKEKGLAAFLQHILSGSTVNYLKKIYLPLGAFSLISPSSFLLTLPILTQNLSAIGNLPRSTYFQYTSLLTSFVFISAIYGYKNLLAWLEKNMRAKPDAIKLFLVYWLIGWSLLLNGKPEGQIIFLNQKKNNPHYQYVRTYLKKVPTNASVRTNEHLAPHLAMRKELYIYENTHVREGGSLKAQNAEYVILERSFLETDWKNDVTLLQQKGYKIINERDGFYVFRKI